MSGNARQRSLSHTQRRWDVQATEAAAGIRVSLEDAAGIHVSYYHVSSYYYV
jgi:hypothetical protein